MIKLNSTLLSAIGIRSGKSGTSHFREMKISSVMLLLLTPLFVFTFGSIVGESHKDVTAFFAKPFPALICALTLIVSFAHFKSGAIIAVEDYSKGIVAKILINCVKALSYSAVAVGLFAIARMAL